MSQCYRDFAYYKPLDTSHTMGTSLPFMLEQVHVVLLLKLGLDYRLHFSRFQPLYICPQNSDRWFRLRLSYLRTWICVLDLEMMPQNLTRYHRTYLLQRFRLPTGIFLAWRYMNHVLYFRTIILLVVLVQSLQIWSCIMDFCSDFWPYLGLP